MRKTLLAGVVLIVLQGVIPPASASPLTFSYTGGIVDYTIPVAGLYVITTAGAQGGDFEWVSPSGPGPQPPLSVPGGQGATVSGEYQLAAGDVLQISVGGRGGNGIPAVDANVSGGGGGGSVVIGPGGLLAVAGGGAGANYASGGGGLTTPNGGGLHGGTNGSGGGYDGVLYTDPFTGTTTLGSYGGGGGGGYSGVGGGTHDPNLGLMTAVTGGGLVFGGEGGRGAEIDDNGAFEWGGDGGFGGGGGAGTLAGGGGGYSGGDDGGTGGGSYLDPSALDPVLIAADNAGDGYVTIDLDPPDPPVPEPSSLALLAPALLGLLALRRHRAR